MPTMLAEKYMTVAEFERLDSDLRYYLFRGELRPMSPLAGFDHGVATFDLGWYLNAHIRQYDRGRCVTAETGFVVERNPDTVLAPDWAFIAKNRLPESRTRGFGKMVPDAVVEVRSPTNSRNEVDQEIEMWLAVGVKLVMELNLITQVLTVCQPGKVPYELGIDDVLTNDGVLPGLHLPLRHVFSG